jgi:hypothetical protein
MVVYRAWVWDDRALDDCGALQEDEVFSARDKALKWLADWIRDDVEQHDEEAEAFYNRVVDLHEAGQYEALVEEYPGHFTGKWEKEPLRLGVQEVAVQ